MENESSFIQSREPPQEVVETVCQVDETMLARDALLQRYEDMPNRRVALKAKDHNDQAVIFRLGVAHKLYNCFVCHDSIPIGSEHVINNHIQSSTKYNHEHLHTQCLHETILPIVSAIEVVKASEASDTQVYAQRRQYRNQRRRR